MQRISQTSRTSLPSNVRSTDLLPQMQFRRYAEYGNNLEPKTCFSQLPQVPCGSTGDCVRWMVENCSDNDFRSTEPVCNVGMCTFGILPN